MNGQHGIKWKFNSGKTNIINTRDKDVNYPYTFKGTKLIWSAQEKHLCMNIGSLLNTSGKHAA